MVDVRTLDGVREEGSVSVESERYETPRLIPIGNLHDVVAVTSQQLNCDGTEFSGQGDNDMTCA